MTSSEDRLDEKRSARIVVVDDDQDLLFANCRMLRKAGYEVHGAGTGEEALATVHRECPDLVLLDRVLPDRDGLEVCKEIKQSPRLARTCVILASGFKTAAEDQVDGLTSGADGYIVRPIGNRELLARVESFLRIVQQGRTLRKQAEKVLGASSREETVSSPEAPKELFHELRVHQVELEMQNEELRRAQAELEISRDRFADLYHQAPVGYATIDEAGIIQEVNHTLADMLRLTASQLRGGPFSRYVAEEDREVFFGRFKAFLRHPEGKTMDLQLVCEDRTLLTVSLQGRSLKDTSPRGRAGFGRLIQVSVMDIGERKKMEEALREACSKYQTIVDNTSLGIMMLSKDLRILEINQTMRDRLQRGEWSDQPFCYQVLRSPPAEGPCQDCPTVKTLFDGHVHETITQVEGPIGVRSYRVLSSPIRNSRGEINAAIEIVEDTTDRLLREAQQQQAQKLEAIGTLAGGIAHDFNNVLSPIIGYTEMVRNDLPENAPGRGDLEQVLAAAYRARDLVKQILAFSRHGGDQKRIPTDISTVAKEALKLLRASIPSSIEIRENMQRGVAMVDATQIHQVLVNLCTNAFHAMGEKGVLGVSLSNIDLGEQDMKKMGVTDLEPGPYLKLSVSDTGHGMDKETSRKVFDPFFTTKEVGKGTGLGLAVVHGIVKRHGGVICVSSESGKGSVFDVYLPSAGSGMAGVCATARGWPTGTERVLVVDDEPMVAELGSRMLGRLGYTVTTKTNALEALETFRGSPRDFDLILTDYAMPGMTGTELADEVLKIRADVPIILCTGYSERGTEMSAEESGIRARALKPLDRGKLAELVRKVLDAAGMPRRTIDDSSKPCSR